MSTHKHRAIVSVTNDLATDQRVHKVCSFLQQQGYTVMLLGRRLPASLEIKRSYQTKRFRLVFNKGPLFYANYNLRLFCYLLFHKAEILVANDLDTLWANAAIKRLRPSCKLVYDSHEYFTEVPELLNRPRVKTIWEKIERRNLPKADFCYTVNDAIAKRYEEKYKKKFLVVRNVAPTWHQPKKLLTKAELGIPEGSFILIFQGAGINMHRGGEEMLKAMKDLPECTLLFVGDGDAVPYLKEEVKKQGLTNVLFFGKRPYEELLNFTYHADLGLSLDQATNLNYALSLPNKVFDYIQTATPILASSMQEVKKLIDTHQIGMTLDEITPKSLVKSIQNILNNKELYQRWKANCKQAGQVETWEEEVKKLHKIYPKK